MTQRAALARAAWASLCALVGGCTLITDSFLTNDFSGDPFPIGIDTSTGAILVGLRAGDGAPDRRAVLDLLSPFTLDDPGIKTEPSLSTVDLTLLGKAPDGTLTLPRARFPEAQLLALHPCDLPSPEPADQAPLPACMIGPRVDTDQPQFDAVIGADALAGDAVRLRIGDQQMFVLADVGGNDRGRTLSCDAVFDSPYRGGGTLVLSGTELPFGNRRITLQACLGPDPDPDPQLAPTDPLPSFPEPLAGDAPVEQRCMRENSRQTIADMLQKTLDPGHAGSDALFVVSTSIGVSILGEAAYGRYVDAHPGATPLKDLNDPGEVYLPSGLVQGMRAKIDRMALVAASSGNALAPCRQLYAHRLQSLLGPIDASEFAGCQDPTGKPLSFASACKNGSAFCLAPGIVELSPQDGSGIDVLVVSDDNDTLQALRTELRPDQPEVDGILGTNALRAAEIDVDYPHDRLLARCPGAGCITRPELAAAGDRCQINHCIKGQAAFRNQAPAGASPSDPHLPGCP